MNAILPSIMQSIKPQYCELIATGRKTYEVRKTKPNIPTPFKSYIYCTKNTYSGGVIKQPLYLSNNELFMKSKIGVYDFEIVNGKVIGEYICDEIQEWVFDNEYTYSYDISDDDLALTCLTQEQLWEYGKGKTLYGYHITNLKIYDEPKELSAFKGHKRMWYGSIYLPLTRPPQSWLYCEEVS